MKINKIKQMNDREIIIMNKINNISSKGFPKVIDYGEIDTIIESNIETKYNKHSFIIMNKLGKSLKDMLITFQKRFCLIDTLKLGIKLINLIE